MTIAQQIADLAQTDFPAAMKQAVKLGRKAAVWYAGCEYNFEDFSVLTVRAGKVESPEPSPIVWTAAKRVAFDV